MVARVRHANRQAVIVDIGYALSNGDRLGTSEFACRRGLSTQLAKQPLLKRPAKSPKCDRADTSSLVAPVGTKLILSVLVSPGATQRFNAIVTSSSLFSVRSSRIRLV
jgi:hypothetical protein